MLAGFACKGANIDRLTSRETIAEVAGSHPPRRNIDLDQRPLAEPGARAPSVAFPLECD